MECSSCIKADLKYIFPEARNILRKLRDDQVRDGDIVVKLWEDVLMDASHKLGNECE